MTTDTTTHPASTSTDDLFRPACRAVFDAMARQRIDLLEVDYDGYGDSGQIVADPVASLSESRGGRNVASGGELNRPPPRPRRGKGTAARRYFP